MTEHCKVYFCEDDFNKINNFIEALKLSNKLSLDTNKIITFGIIASMPMLIKKLAPKAFPIPQVFLQWLEQKCF
jgi:hypothetical protein